MRKHVMAAGVLFFSLAAVLNAQMPEVERQVQQTAEALTESYFHGRQVNFRENLAIVAFRDISTARKHGNIARGVEDLFTAVFSRSTRFRLVERRNIETLMEEQKLQLMGITDSDSTVELGQIRNARALLLGTVNTVGPNYLVSVRLVNVETGQLVSESLTLDREEMIAAKRRLDMEYISAMGVGISLLGYDLTFAGNSPSLDFNAFSTTIFGRPFGVEFKYRVTTWLMLGAGIEAAGGNLHYFDSITYNYQGYSGITTSNSGPFVLYSEGFGLLANAYLVWPASRRFSLFASAGVEYLILDVEGYFHPDIEISAADNKQTVGNGFGFDEFGPRETETGTVLRLRAGFELFLSPRAAFSLKGGWDIGVMDLNLVRQWHLTDLPENMTVDLGGITVAPSISVYF
jgi:TolB-like protein